MAPRPQVSSASTVPPGIWFQALRRMAPLLVLPLLLSSLLTLNPSPAEAASGGRIGGGSFRSAPRSYGGGGSYRGGGPGSYRGGYGGGYGGGYYGGGGFGVPFVLPLFGFGGGLFGLLVLMAVAGVLLNALRSAGGRLGGSDDPLIDGVDGPVSIAQVQVGLLASARELQADLRRMANSADTASSEGLQKVLQETTLSLLRHPDLWVYANAEVGQVPFPSAEATFNRLSVRERSKLERELTTNVAGSRSSLSSARPVGTSDATSDYIAVTLLVASRNSVALKGADNAETLRDSLQRLAAVGASDLLALEVIWQPEGAGEVLSAEQLITAYPQLQHL